MVQGYLLKTTRIMSKGNNIPLLLSTLASPTGSKSAFNYVMLRFNSQLCKKEKPHKGPKDVGQLTVLAYHTKSLQFHTRIT